MRTVYFTSDPAPAGQTTTEQMAQVVSCDADQIHLAIPAQRCRSCQRQNGCGAAWITRLWPRRSYPLKIARDRVTFPVQVGDQVRLVMHQSAVQQTVWCLYGWPLSGLLLGALVGAGIADWLALHGELLSICLGLAGLTAGLVGARYSARSGAAVAEST